MELYAAVRRSVYVEGLSERAAARRFGLARETPTMQSSMAPSQVVPGGRKVAIRRPRVRRAGAELRIQRGALRSTTRRFVVDARVGVRSVVQPGVDHAHQLVGGGKAPSRNPTLRGPDD